MKFVLFLKYVVLLYFGKIPQLKRIDILVTQLPRPFPLFLSSDLQKTVTWQSS